ncbi:flavin monoamine oxidase family protein [Pseudooctadecabacter sp.]|uniref:flavin monoamine oxidase family protein n=1 Tax=Pseudooctadecabacter sp. TaxID=1966338 RepID=UPI0035C830D4
MKTIIIGGGLSGLALAATLDKAGADFTVFEARDRFGGRILTEHHGGAAFDLGPAWFWPGQPRIAALIDQLGLEKFDQYATGDLTFEDETGQIHRGQGFASMQGSWRLKNGFGALIDALVADISAESAHLNASVRSLENTPNGVRVTQVNGTSHLADRVVLALPPRLASTLTFTPALPDDVQQSMIDIPTWMAGQAKTVAIYATPFWRDTGLSGDAMSRRGPMIEVHDASPAVGGPYALFGFIGVPPQARIDDQALKKSALSQLIRLFGPAAAEPEAMFVTDWARAPRTSTPYDQAPLYAHPTYGLPPQMNGLWDGKLILSGTETAPQFGGYLEGALEAADITARSLLTPESGP